MIGPRDASGQPWPLLGPGKIFGVFWGFSLDKNWAGLIIERTPIPPFR